MLAMTCAHFDTSKLQLSLASTFTRCLDIHQGVTREMGEVLPTHLRLSANELQ